MGFYIRKAFSAGPIRFNLSKSGIGISAGVTGARIGRSPGGRTYVHGGRWGLYYRKTLSSGSGSGRSRGGTRRSPAASAGAPIELTEDTGVTYASAVAQPESRITAALVAPDRRSPPTYTGYALVGLVVGVALPSFLPAVALPVVAGVWIAHAVARTRKMKAGESYGGLIAAAFVSADPGAKRAALEAARRDPALTPDDRRYFEQQEYRALIETVTAKAAEDPGVFDRFAAAETLVDIDPAYRRLARLDAYLRAHIEAVSDHDLTEAEEEALARTRTAFGLTDEELADELALLDDLTELRAIRDGELPVVRAQTRLTRREVCHFEGEGRLLKRRLLRSFSEDGQRYKVRGYLVHKEGTLIVTSRRVALVHQGVTSYPLAKILDVEVDQDRALIILTRDRVATPTFITTPDALRAGAILAALTTDRFDDEPDD